MVIVLWSCAPSLLRSNLLDAARLPIRGHIGSLRLPDLTKLMCADRGCPGVPRSSALSGGISSGVWCARKRPGSGSVQWPSRLSVRSIFSININLGWTSLWSPRSQPRQDIRMRRKLRVSVASRDRGTIRRKVQTWIWLTYQLQISFSPSLASRPPTTHYSPFLDPS